MIIIELCGSLWEKSLMIFSHFFLSFYFISIKLSLQDRIEKCLFFSNATGNFTNKIMIDYTVSL